MNKQTIILLLAFAAIISITSAGAETLRLVQKDTNWEEVPGGAEAVLTYTPSGVDFEFNLAGQVSKVDEKCVRYSLVYYIDQPIRFGNWGRILPLVASTSIANESNSEKCDIMIPQTKIPVPSFPAKTDLNYENGSKLWLIPDDNIDWGITYGLHMTGGWFPTNYLFEENVRDGEGTEHPGTSVFIRYEDTGASEVLGDGGGHRWQAEWLYQKSKNMTDQNLPWDVTVGGDFGLVMYTPTGYNLTMVFTGKVNDSDTNYALVYYKDQPDRFINWGWVEILGEGVSNGAGYLQITVDKPLGHNIPIKEDINNLTGGKIWVVPRAHINETGDQMIQWSESEYLYEDVLIKYEVPVVATPTPTATQSPSSNGGSSGGFGVTSTENLNNIQRYETVEGDLKVGQYVAFIFKTNLPLTKVDVKGTRNEYDVALRVELLKDLSSKLSDKPVGTVYKYINIFTDARNDGAKISFKVENQWMRNNNIASVDLLRWTNSAWKPLNAVQTGSDSTYTYFEAVTEGFSSFAIVGKMTEPAVSGAAPVTVVTQTPFVTVTASITQTPKLEFEYDIFPVIVGMIVVAILVLAALYIVIRKRKDQQEQQPPKEQV